jgi:arylsulfatase A
MMLASPSNVMHYSAWLASALAVLICPRPALGFENFSKPDSSPTNVVLIMADDIGWEAFGSYGGEDYHTPNLDRLCREGLRFAHCYSTPLCTPSRVQIMTGKYNFRNYTHFGYLDPQQRTFGNLMKDAGYATAVAGKWQLNGLANDLPGCDDNSRPNHFGFDEYLLWQLTLRKKQENGGERYWSPLLEQNGKVMSVRDNHLKYGPDLMADFVCDFIESNRHQPFFVYYPMLLVHDPFVPTPDTIGNRSRGHESNLSNRDQAKDNFAAMVQYMDKIVGRIIDHLQSLGLLENTLVLFTSDNGTHPSITSMWNGLSIQGGKGGTTDMGTHVPLIAYWKGHPNPGTVVEDLVDFTDFYPTLAELSGQSAEGTDGISFLPQLTGKPGRARKWTFCHYQPFWGNRQPAQFARTHSFKLYRDGRFYHVPQDREEQTELPETDLTAEAKRDLGLLRQVINGAPSVPEGIGNRDTHQRTIYPDWQQLGDPSNW